METHKDFSAGPIIAAIVLMVIALVVFVILPNMLQTTNSLRIGDGIFRARIASNQTEREKGLSGVGKLEPDQALLMLFPTEGKWNIWMKDMLVPIDIVWLDKDKKVIFIVKEAQPEASTSTIFEPKAPAKYVIELPAGTVDSKAINLNATAIFDVNESDVE